MKRVRKLAIASVAFLILAAGSVTVFAASRYETPAETVAALTGRQVQSVIDQRTQTGKTYGAIAEEAGVLEKFRSLMLEMKKDTLAARVQSEKMTQEEADAILAQIETNKASCTGTCMGVGFGQRCHMGKGQKSKIRLHR